MIGPVGSCFEHVTLFRGEPVPDE